MSSPHLHRSLTTVEYFSFGFGTMIGVGWVIVMDDWLGRGGPAGAALGYLLGGLLLLPIAYAYSRLVRQIPDAGAEIAYCEGLFPPLLSFATGWIMVLAYLIVCPWEAVAIGNLLARILPQLNSVPLYQVAGQTIYAPRLVAGLLLTLLIAALNYRGIRLSGRFQNWTTFGLLAIFVVFVALGLARGDASRLAPGFAHEGGFGAALSILLVLQIVPYFMIGFESIAKSSEESRVGYDPRGFGRAMFLAVAVGTSFYVLVIVAVSLVFPWQELVAGRLGTEAAFERAFGSRIIAQAILLAAFLSLLKVFNGNFVAATRLAFAIGRRGLVHPALARLHPTYGTPRVAILLMSGLTVAAALLGDAVLIPVTEVGSLAVGFGWLSACVSLWMRQRRPGSQPAVRLSVVGLGAAVSLAIILMKLIPAVPGSFGAAEWAAFAGWCALGLLFWSRR